ncbi:MAG: type VI secretion system tube protein Hcp, partial [Bacteroidota bacterium]
GAAHPAPQAFMEIVGVAGASQDPAHRGWIELLTASLQDRGADPAATGCRRLGLSATKLVDSASPQLASLAASHRTEDVTLDGLTGRRTLRGAVIESVTQLGATVGGAPAHESLSVVGLECISAAPPRGIGALGGTTGGTIGIRNTPPSGGIAVKNGPAHTPGIAQAPPGAPRPGIAPIPKGPINVTVAALRVDVAAPAALQPIAQTVPPLKLEVAPGVAPKAVTLTVQTLRLDVTRAYSSLNVATAKVASGGVSVAVAPLRIDVAAAPPLAPITVAVPALQVAVGQAPPPTPLSISTAPLTLSVERR